MHDYCAQRPAEVWQFLQSEFNLDSKRKLNLDVSNSAHGYVKVNSIEINNSTHGVPTAPYPWEGDYFEGIPIALTAVPIAGSRFVEWQGDASGNNPNITVNMTSNKNIIAVFETCNNELVHYWHFNNLPDGNLSLVQSDLSKIGGAEISYEGSGNGYFDRTNSSEGSNINLQDNVNSGRALRVRNPSNTRHLLIKIPSTGYGDLVLSFDAMRTNNGSQNQSLYYSTNGGNDWQLLEANYTIKDAFQNFSFTIADAATYDNSDLQFKIEFTGPNNDGNSGNNRIDNISLHGVAATFTYQSAKICMGDVHQFEYLQLTQPGSYTVSSACASRKILDLEVETFDTTLTLLANSYYANEANASYQWIDCDNNFNYIPGATQREFTPTKPGNYAVEMRRNNCFYNSTCVNTIFLNVEEQAYTNNYKLFPNPASDKIFIQATNTDNEKSTVTIYNIQGKEVYRAENQFISNFEIDVNVFQHGIYMVNIQSESQKSVLKFVR